MKFQSWQHVAMSAWWPYFGIRYIPTFQWKPSKFYALFLSSNLMDISSEFTTPCFETHSTGWWSRLHKTQQEPHRVWWLEAKGIFTIFCLFDFDPVTPKSDQCRIYPAASLEIWHHTVWRTWLFIAHSDEKWLYYKFSLHHSYNRFLKGWENTLFELRSERV